VEEPRTAGEGIDVRRFRQRIAVAPQRRAQVVDGDEQHVGLRGWLPRFVRRLQRGWQRQKQQRKKLGFHRVASNSLWV
jgi:hypothetical protein